MPINATIPAQTLEPAYIKRAVQDAAELKAFAQFVQQQNVRSYLEIGAKYGGSFWHVMRAMPRGSLGVAVDLPFLSTFKRPVSEPYLKECIAQLKGKSYDVHLILGDSTSESVIEQARQHAPYDLCLIDANHEEAFVRADWANYGPMANIVAFHDVSWDMARNPGKLFRIDVPKVWNEIKVGYRHQEIRLCKTKDNGFGILWR
jgi:cephalosporin hydroxylase